jgi:phage-related holin
MSYFNFLGKLFGVLIAYFSPIQALFHVILFFIVVDWITGVYSSYKCNVQITSFKLRATIEKFVFYNIAVMITFVFQKELFFNFNLANIVAGYIAVTELKSIFENIFKITKLDILSAILQSFKEKIWFKDFQKKKKKK